MCLAVWPLPLPTKQEPGPPEATHDPPRPIRQPPHLLPPLALQPPRPALQPRRLVFLPSTGSLLRSPRQRLEPPPQRPPPLQAQSLLRTCPQLAEKLLEDFLCFADAYGIFQCSVLAFKEAQMAVQVAIRKKDESKIASYMKARKRIHKEMRDLTSTIKCVAKCGILHGLDHSPASDAELAAGILGVVEATALVSLALFDRLALSFPARRSSWSSQLRLSKKAKVDERIEELGCTEERLWSLRK